MHATIAKLVFAGPVGAGKSAAIRALADAAPVSTEMPLSDGPMGEKTTTTVALDFATLTLDDGMPVFLYGVPGQEHFAFMRSIVLEGAIGVIVLLDARAADVAGHCRHWLGAIRDINAGIGIVVGITQTDRAEHFDLSQVREAIREAGAPVPVFIVDAREREQVGQLVRALLVATG